LRRSLLPQFISLLALAARAMAQESEPFKMPTWQDEIGKGFVPYHQLKVDDFKIDDKGHPQAGYWIKPFIHPYWHFIYTRKDWYYAYVDQWVIYSGLDKNESSRHSKTPDMEKRLPHVQAYLDLNEICARQLAALKPGELPSGRGATPEEARNALYQNIDAILKARYKAFEDEAEQFQKATEHGANMKKVRELAKAIRKRLDALPAPAGPSANELPVPSPSPTVSAKTP